MSCDGQCGEQGTQTRTRVCDNGNCANATDQSVEIRTGCIATATCTGLLFTPYYDALIILQCKQSFRQKYS